MPPTTFENPPSCPKCGGEMKQGFTVDNSYVGRLVSTWAPGAPRRSLWNMTKLPDGSLPIGTFRCSSCGFLESYAREEFAAE